MLMHEKNMCYPYIINTGYQSAVNLSGKFMHIFHNLHEILSQHSLIGDKNSTRPLVITSEI